MRLRIHHRTEYTYPQPVSESANEVRLKPRQNRWQDCDSCLISVLPAAPLTPYLDLYQNQAHRFQVTEPHIRLVVDSRARVTTKPRIDFEQLPYGMTISDLKQLQELESCYPFLQPSHYISLDREIWRQAVDIQGQSTDVFQTAYAIMEHIFDVYDYREGTTVVSTPAHEVIQQKTGVCQDFAHAMVALCRSLRMPTRYVSGYFFDATHDHRLRGSQASHAWAEVYLKDVGWVGFDPTNRKVVDETYITLAIGRDYQDVAPVAGTFYGGSETLLNVDVRVRRLERAI
jgi:transglutaminase-like putative cysteine protease